MQDERLALVTKLPKFGGSTVLELLLVAVQQLNRIQVPFTGC